MSTVAAAPAPRPGPAPRRISVVIPARNERAGLPIALDEVYRVLGGCGLEPEVVVVDDGSSDGTFDRVRELSERYPNLRALRLSRNYGKEAALLAGLQAARGDVVVTLDADLQHPPSLIPEMLARWRAGARVVHGIKRQASGARRRDRLASSGFNRVMRWLTGIDMHHASDFTLLDRSVVDVIVGQLPERQRFYRALTRWVGFRQESVSFDVPPRAVGSSRWSFLRLLDLALTGIVSFTSLPLRLVTVLGVVTLVFAGVVAGETLWSWAQGTAVSGYSTIIITLLFVGSSIMISLGILGEYVARIYHEVKARPGFLIEDRFGFDAEPSRDDG